MRLGVELESHVNNETKFLYTANFKKKDGTIFPGEVNVYYLHNDEGTLTGFIGLIRDITERKRSDKIQKDLEAQLHQAQKMEAIGRLASSVAHDFNNLLSIILGYEEIVLEALGKDHLYHEPLEQVYQAGIRAKDLTRQLLAFSRKQVLEMKTEDVNIVVTGFEKLLRRLIGEDIQLILALNPEPLIVMADTAQLEQVLMNLAVNSRDAMPDGGTLTIETAVVQLDDTYTDKKTDVSPGIYAMIGVSDTGCGMDKETLDHLYEPFFTTKAIDKGTGLGLATSYGIVKQHGGNIYVYSEPGEGTVFKIYLPLYTQKGEVQALPAKSQTPITGSATVLIMEDEPSVRKLAVRILADHGYTVIESDDAADAINKAKAHDGPIHLVLTDVVMPGMKGPEAYVNISIHHPEAKVLYMSGYTDNIISSSGVPKKGIQIIQKPFTVNGLLEKCHQVLHNK
jgi:two-component system, cell cycle sensor histidine kinase and response regulator CckA